MSSDDELPRVRLRPLQEQRRSLAWFLDHRFRDQLVDHDMARSAASDLERRLGWYPAYKGIVTHLYLQVGQRPDRKVINEISWRLAANEEFLRGGYILPAERGGRAIGWELLVVSGLAMIEESEDYRLTLLPISGRLAGTPVSDRYSIRQLRWLAGRLGFDYRQLPFKDRVDKLMRLMFFGQFVENRLDEVAITKQLRTDNRRIIRMRDREPDRDRSPLGNDGRPKKRMTQWGCPLNYEHECVDCQERRCVGSMYVEDFHFPA